MVKSTSGGFWNHSFLDSLTSPLYGNTVPDTQWDTYVTIDTDGSTPSATAVSPGFGDEVNWLKTDFTTWNAAYYITPDDYPQGLADGGRVMIAQFTMQEGEYLTYFKLNMMLADGSKIIGAEIPAPSGFGLLGLVFLASRARRRLPEHARQSSHRHMRSGPSPQERKPS